MILNQWHDCQIFEGGESEAGGIVLLGDLKTRIQTSEVGDRFGTDLRITWEIQILQIATIRKILQTHALDSRVAEIQ